MNYDRLVEELKQDEGFRSKPYYDSVGKLTIGYGRNLTDVGITEREASDLLTNDIIKAYRIAAELVPIWALLDDARQDVLANMAFNMGAGTLATFKNFLAAVNSKQFGLAAKHGRDSKWYKQVGQRAERLMTVMETGDVPSR